MSPSPRVFIPCDFYVFPVILFHDWGTQWTRAAADPVPVFPFPFPSPFLRLRRGIFPAPPPLPCFQPRNRKISKCPDQTRFATVGGKLALHPAMRFSFKGEDGGHTVRGSVAGGSSYLYFVAGVSNVSFGAGKIPTRVLLNQLGDFPDPTHRKVVADSLRTRTRHTLRYSRESARRGKDGRGCPWLRGVLGIGGPPETGSAWG